MDQLEIRITVYADGSLFVASQIKELDTIESILHAAFQALKDQENSCAIH